HRDVIVPKIGRPHVRHDQRIIRRARKRRTVEEPLVGHRRGSQDYNRKGRGLALRYDEADGLPRDSWKRRRAYIQGPTEHNVARSCGKTIDGNEIFDATNGVERGLAGIEAAPVFIAS